MGNWCQLCTQSQRGDAKLAFGGLTVESAQPEASAIPDSSNDTR